MEDRKQRKNNDEEFMPDLQIAKDKEIGPLDSNYPLMKEFREKAAGTFKHTQTLLSMVENVCAAIDMDPEVMKLAATYHDIGKTWAPQVFIENQSGENIHLKMDPYVSYTMITRHVSDSVVILLNNNFPRNVMKIVSQHHGTCILRSMYERAKETNPEINEDDFRYHTGKPDSVESMILMLCDHMEATSRSIYVDQKNSDVDPADLVINMLHKLQDDGQFDDVHILLGTLKKIQRAVIADVASSFQKRIAYKEDEELTKKR